MTDEPTMTEYLDGSKYWYLNGERHREDGPAIIRSNGTKEWYLNGKRHRVYYPAYEGQVGSKEWYLNGERHREQGPAIIWPDGYEAWFLNGKRHRVDGPAIYSKYGNKYWYEYNELIYSTDIGEENPILKNAWESGDREEFNMVKALIS